MWTDDPVRDFMRWDAEQEQKLQEWEQTRPECPYCGDRIGTGKYIDLSCGDMTDKYVYHDDCFWEALMSDKFTKTEKEIIFELIEEEYGGEER